MKVLQLFINNNVLNNNFKAVQVVLGNIVLLDKINLFWIIVSIKQIKLEIMI